MSDQPEPQASMTLTFRGAEPPWRLHLTVVFVCALLGIDSPAEWLIVVGFLVSALAMHLSWRCDLVAADALGVDVHDTARWRRVVATLDPSPEGPEDAAAEARKWRRANRWRRLGIVLCGTAAVGDVSGLAGIVWHVVAG